VPVVTATDHVTLREAGADEATGDEEHGHGPEDPHVWMDPLAMADLVAALAVTALSRYLVRDRPR